MRDRSPSSRRQFASARLGNRSRLFGVCTRADEGEPPVRRSVSHPPPAGRPATGRPDRNECGWELASACDFCRWCMRERRPSGAGVFQTQNQPLARGFSRSGPRQIRTLDLLISSETRSMRLATTPCADKGIRLSRGAPKADSRPFDGARWCTPRAQQLIS
jgi:hypothetical protein